MGSNEWMPIFRKIQAASKNVILGTSPKITAKMYPELDPKGLLLSTGYTCGIFPATLHMGKNRIDDEN